MADASFSRFINEDTLLVEYGETLNDDVHQQVLALDAALNESSIASRIETLPTFRSLFVRFDVNHLNSESLINTLSELDISHVKFETNRWRVPVCIENRCAEDLDEVAQVLEMDSAKIVARLLSTPLKLYMYGFAPGFAYLGGLDSRLAIPRRSTPRSPMPRGSLMVAGGLASLSSVSTPTGWYVLGQTPISLFEIDRQGLVPFSVGDELQLFTVGYKEFVELSRQGKLTGCERVDP